jgi:Rap1a immunity proteins
VAAAVDLVAAIWVDLDVNYLKAFNMNTLKKIVLFVACLCCYQQSVVAQANMPANDASTAALVELCKNRNDQDAQNFCFGFGEGVFQAYLANQPTNAKPSVCFPQQGGSREAILQEFLRWNRANPQFNSERAAKTLVRFFEQSYPCKR